MNSKVAILFLVLCSMYSRALSRLEKRQTVTPECIAAINSSQLAGLPDFCLAQDTPLEQLCRNCTGRSCQALTGGDAENCRRLFFDGCRMGAQVDVPECETNLPLTADCIANIVTNPDVLQELPASCIALAAGTGSTPLDQVCRDCTGTSCRLLTGDIAASCRQLFFAGCQAVGETITDCSSALALVTIKGVLAVVLLVAAFLIF